MAREPREIDGLTAGGAGSRATAANDIQGILHLEGRIQKIWDEMPKIWIEVVKMQNILTRAITRPKSLALRPPIKSGPSRNSALQF